MRENLVEKREDQASRSRKRSEEHRQPQLYISGISEDADLDEQARIVYKCWPSYPLDPFLNTTAVKKRWVKEAFDNGEGWAVRLFGALENPYVYTLHACHLRLPSECGDPKNFYSKANIECWKRAIGASFATPLWWKLELANRVHIHVIADRDAGLPQLRRDGRLVEPIYDGEGLLYYLAKPNAEWNAPNLALYLRAKRLGRLPRLSGTIGVFNRNTWHSTGAFTGRQSQS